MVVTPLSPTSVQAWTQATADRSAVVKGVPAQADGWWYFLLRQADWRADRIVRVRPDGGLADVQTVLDPGKFVAGATSSTGR